MLSDFKALIGRISYMALILAKGGVFEPFFITQFVNLYLAQGSEVGLDGKAQDQSVTKPMALQRTGLSAFPQDKCFNKGDVYKVKCEGSPVL